MLQIFRFCVFFPLICHIQGYNNHEYCSLSPNHVMCKTKNETCPFEGLAVWLSDNQVRTIVELHNDLRAVYASGKGMFGKFPKASNMMLMTRDTELERIAHRAVTCDKVSKDFSFDVKRFKVKSNLFSDNHFNNAQQLPENFIQSLKSGNFSTHREVSKSIVSNYQPSEEYDFIAGAIWATTNKIGCGLVFKDKGHKFSEIFCLYGPAGNIRGESIYEEGEPCSTCPDDVICIQDTLPE